MEDSTVKEKRKKSRKRKWKPVSLDNPSFFTGDMGGFVSLEILEDYDLDSLRGFKGDREEPVADSLQDNQDNQDNQGADEESSETTRALEVGKVSYSHKRTAV